MTLATPSSVDTGYNIPDKFRLGIMTIMADAKMAASCVDTNDEMTNPSAVAAVENSTAPRISVTELPVTGT